jgi:glucosamine 6-phosphate synthetase-like amidotransferase/phosphosugar isomerase protein
MCGIFGFVLKKPIETTYALKVLQKLERHQYPNEPKPVGGYGAGIAVLTSSGTVLLEKVGKVDGSPLEHLAKTCRLDAASVLIGHVRLPSPWFMETAHFRETAQPYVARCFSCLRVVSAHNGNIANYKAIREKLGEKHFFESERTELIDSEVIPHLFEELLLEKGSPKEALNRLFLTIEGPNAASLLQIEKGRMLLHFLHKGKTRGLTIWKNYRGEVIFCSRKEPIKEELGSMLEEGSFAEHVSIPYNEERSLKTTFTLSLP